MQSEYAIEFSYSHTIEHRVGNRSGLGEAGALSCDYSAWCSVRDENLV